MRSLSFLFLVACTGTSTDEPASAPGEHAAHEGHEDHAGGKAKGKKAKGDAHAATPAPAALPAGAKVTFVEPVAGAKVKSPVAVKFAVEGMTVRPAGEIVPETGHHHLVIDGGPIAAGTVVPMDDKHLHFGKGQTETTVELPPGEHKLTMQFADGAHVSYGEAMSSTVTVTVE
jgi:hypothetical protein